MRRKTGGGGKDSTASMSSVPRTVTAGLTPPTTLSLLARAERAGKNIGTLCARIHASDGERPGVNRILGVLALTKRHGAGAVEQACALALEVELPSYRFIKRYFEKCPPVQLTLRQVDPIIRELTYYRDLIDRRTQET